MTDSVLVARQLGKKFCRDFNRSLAYGLRDIAAELFCRTAGFGQLRPHEFWALEDANFELLAGDSLGILGRNGAGKSTLLKLIAGIIKPDRGTLEVRGRVGALIALGAGFNPLLTGRENIYVSSAVLGHSRRETDALLERIVEFSELQNFIDMPVQNYSSGMHVRLGFAVAAHLEPDIMLVDEVLAVGDSTFQRKCFDRIYEMQNHGTSFVVVSHSPYQIERLCNKATVVHDGRLSPLLAGKDAIALYHDLCLSELAAPNQSLQLHREGTHELSFDSILIEDNSGQPVETVQWGSTIRIVATFRTLHPLQNVRVRFEICSADNAVVLNITANGHTEHRLFDGSHRIAFEIGCVQLTSGWYAINAIAVDRNIRLDTWSRAAEMKVVMKDEQARLLSSDAGQFVCDGRWIIE